MTKYKIRLFYKATVTYPNTATGEIEIKKGSKDYVLGLLNDNLKFCDKVIIEVV